MPTHLGGRADDARSRQTVAQRRAEGAGKPWPRGITQGDGDALAALYRYLKAERAERPSHGGLGWRKACPPAAHDTSFLGMPVLPALTFISTAWRRAALSSRRPPSAGARRSMLRRRMWRERQAGKLSASRDRHGSAARRAPL